MLHIHKNTVRQRSDQDIKNPCKIKVWGERQLQKVEVAALLSMLKEDNYYKRILV